LNSWAPSRRLLKNPSAWGIDRRSIPYYYGRHAR
jgi:hypothetical protein